MRYQNLLSVSVATIVVRYYIVGTSLAGSDTDRHSLVCCFCLVQLSLQVILCHICNIRLTSM